MLSKENKTNTTSRIKREKLVSSDKYLDWLVSFTERTYNKSWDDETAELSASSVSNHDIENIINFSVFLEKVEHLAKKQYALSYASNKVETCKYCFKLRGNFYEISNISKGGSINIIRKIITPPETFVYIDEKISPQELKSREFIQYILLNKEIGVSESVYSVHIAHVCTQVAMSAVNTQKFDLWYNNNQKIIILDDTAEHLESISKDFFASRDSGHNDIPKNSLIAVSLGIISRKNAEDVIANCTLHN